MRRREPSRAGGRGRTGLQGDWPRYVASNMDRILEHLQVQWRREGELLVQDTNEIRELFGRLGRAFGEEPLAGVDTFAELGRGVRAALAASPGDPAPFPSLVGLTEENERLRQVLVNVIETLAGAANAGRTGRCRRSGRRSGGSSGARWTGRASWPGRRSCRSPRPSPGPRRTGEAGMARETVHGEQVAEYFAHRMPEATGIEVRKLRRNVGGMSRETWFLDLGWRQDGREHAQEFTIRVDPPGGSVVPTPLLYEYQIHGALQGTDVPVARPLWFEEDPAWLGAAPFYVRELIEGSSAPKQLWQEGQEELRASIGRHFAELLARVHRLHWKAAGFEEFMDVPKDDVDCALLELGRWKRYYEEHRVESKPVMAELFGWLEANAPRHVERVSLVWGDVGLGNFIFRGDRIVGLTDWEQAHLGDPMKDWASALWRGIDNLLDRQELFHIYEEACGIAIDPAGIEYYTAFICTEYVCTSHPAIRFILQGDNIDVTLARLVLGIPYSCQEMALGITGS